jgi:hypothetical protein
VSNLKLVLLLAAGCASDAVHVTTAALQNDCADPLWQNTLRCKVHPLPYDTPGGPANVADVKSFTRVLLLNDPTIRCVDGTAPTIYVDRGTSNNWVFTVSGGGSCRPNGTDASDCVRAYLGGEGSEMGSGSSKPMMNLDGIYDPDPRNPFASYNRVRIDKCSMDKMLGRVAHVGLTGDVDQDGIVEPPTETFDAWQQGYRHITATFDALLNGLTYTTWVNNGGAVQAVQETMPALASADQILFIGHSGGAQGLMHNLDYLAGELDGRGLTADFRGLFDAQFMLSQENEAAFNGLGDAYDHIASGSTFGDGQAFDYDGTYWQGAYKDALDVWNAQIDASCLASPGPAWKCRDYIHVLMNHVATPFMIREDFTDHKHSNGVHDADWGHCGGVPCGAGFRVPVEHGPRLQEQSDRVFLDFATRSDLAVNADTTYANQGLPGTTPSIALWMPRCSSHAGAYDRVQFLGVTLPDGAGGTVTMADVAVEFMSLARHGEQRMYRDDKVLTGTKTSSCP